MWLVKHWITWLQCWYWEGFTKNFSQSAVVCFLSWKLAERKKCRIHIGKPRNQEWELLQTEKSSLCIFILRPRHRIHARNELHHGIYHVSLQRRSSFLDLCPADPTQQRSTLNIPAPKYAWTGLPRGDRWKVDRGSVGRPKWISNRLFKPCHALDLSAWLDYLLVLIDNAYWKECRVFECFFQAGMVVFLLNVPGYFEAIRAVHNQLQRNRLNSFHFEIQNRSCEES